MVTVECKECAGIWSVQDDAMQNLEVCPFCAAPLREGHEVSSGAAGVDTLGKVIYGAYAADTDVLQNPRKLGSALHQLADTPLQKLIRLFVWHIGVDYMDDLRAAFEQPLEEIDGILHTLRDSLQEKDGFSVETADVLVGAIREAAIYAQHAAAEEAAANDNAAVQSDAAEDGVMTEDAVQSDAAQDGVAPEHAAVQPRDVEDDATTEDAVMQSSVRDESAIAEDSDTQSMATEADETKDSATVGMPPGVAQSSDIANDHGSGRLTGIEILEIVPDASILRKVPEPETEIEKELDECIKAAEQGSAQDVYKLAGFYRDGRGVKRNMDRAVGWYRHAAELGLPEAQNALGDCYRMGLGVRQDMEEAAQWYFRAAEQGYAEADNNLGDLYRAGLPLDDMKEALFTKLMQYTDPDNKYGTNVFEAVLWYRKAAEKGLAVAQNNMGDCYRFGMGVKQDPLQAAQWYRKAAEQGLATAQENLKECYWD